MRVASPAPGLTAQVKKVGLFLFYDNILRHQYGLCRTWQHQGPNFAPSHGDPSRSGAHVGRQRRGEGRAARG